MWLENERTLDSYAFYHREEEDEKDRPPRVLVLCRSLAETKRVSVSAIRLEEYEHELWWASQLDKDKWHRFQPKNDYKKYEKLKMRARKGVPGPLRGDVWPILSGARDLREPDAYAKLLLQQPQPEPAERIRRDLDRTLPHHPLFQSPAGYGPPLPHPSPPPPPDKTVFAVCWWPWRTGSLTWGTVRG